MIYHERCAEAGRLSLCLCTSAFHPGGDGRPPKLTVSSPRRASAGTRSVLGAFLLRAGGNWRLVHTSVLCDRSVLTWECPRCPFLRKVAHAEESWCLAPRLQTSGVSATSREDTDPTSARPGRPLWAPGALPRDAGRLHPRGAHPGLARSPHSVCAARAVRESWPGTTHCRAVPVWWVTARGGRRPCPLGQRDLIYLTVRYWEVSAGFFEFSYVLVYFLHCVSSHSPLCAVFNRNSYVSDK